MNYYANITGPLSDTFQYCLQHSYKTWIHGSEFKLKTKDTDKRLSPGSYGMSIVVIMENNGLALVALECAIMQKLQRYCLTIPNNGIPSKALLIISNWCHLNMTIVFYEFMIYFNMIICNFSNANIQMSLLMHTHAHKQIRNKLIIHIEHQDLSQQILHAWCTYIIP